MKLRKKQLELQKLTIDDFEIKIKKDIERKQRNGRQTIEDTFFKKYLKPMEQEISKLRDEKLPKIIEKIFINDKYKDRICKLYNEDNLKDSNLKRKAKELAPKLQEAINFKSIYKLKDDDIIKIVYNILKEKNMSLDNSIEELNIKQKEYEFTLGTILLSSGEVAWITFKSLSNILQKDLQDNEDNSTSQQFIIKKISEELFEHIAFKYKRDKIDIEEWENDTEINIGESPFSLLIEANILEEYQKDGEFKNLKFSKEFEKNTKSIYNSMLKFISPSFEPMIVPPTPWTNIDDGGFIKDEESSPKFDLYIMKSTTKRDKANIESQKDKFSPKLLKAVNIIQNTKWQINSDIIDELDIYLKSLKEETKIDKKELIQNKKVSYQEFKKIRIELASNRKLLKDIGFLEEDIKEKLQPKIDEKKEKEKIYYNYLKEINKLDSEINLKEQILKKAKKFKDYSEIYFVWQVDFRGRVYPAQPLLNPQGDDFAKSLLRFATKKALGESGERWFKIHGANLYGEDKISFDDRVKWVDDNRDNILAIFDTDNKFENKFLKKADKPFSFLAFAYEYREFINNPKEFKSALPIAMDGSNNGFQHITALLRDSKGAKKVNVIPTTNQTEPNDIYKDVAEKTIELIENDNSYENIEELEKIKPYINRNLTKKNVMTEVYGAGKDAKKIQLEDFIKNKLNQELKFNEEEIDRVSTYLRDMINKAIKIELSSSNIYKKWMKDIAKQISTQNREIRWTTPIIGLKVIQEEFKMKNEKINTKYNGKKRQIQIKIPTDKIDIKEQRKGIAPNFTHSLDATHLFLTILKSNEKYNIDSFATIHDSFGTHACDIDKLQKAIKNSFIDMFNVDILNKLKNEIEEKYIITLENIQYINKDNFNINEIVESKYFFS